MPIFTKPTAAALTESPARRHRRLPRLLALLALAVPLVAACGGGDDSGGDGARQEPASTSGPGASDAQAYIDAGAASLTADEELALDEETATCISTAVVDLIGADALARAGVTPQELAEAETYDVLAVDVPDGATSRLSQALDDCDVVGAITSFFADELGVELPPDAIPCLDESIDREAVNDAMATDLLAPSDEAVEDQAGLEDTLQTALVDAVVACPMVVTAMFLSEAPGTVTPQAQACVSGVVEANRDRVSGAMEGDAAAAQELGTEIASTCPDSLGG